MKQHYPLTLDRDTLELDTDAKDTVAYLSDIFKMPSAARKQILREHGIDLKKKKILKCYEELKSVDAVIEQICLKYEDEISAWEKSEDKYRSDVLGIHIYSTIIANVDPYETLPQVAKLINQIAKLPDPDDEIDTKDDLEPFYKVIRKTIKAGKTRKVTSTEALFELFRFDFGFFFEYYLNALLYFKWKEEELDEILELATDFVKQFPGDPMSQEFVLTCIDMFENIGLTPKLKDFIQKTSEDADVPNDEIADALLDIALFMDDALLAEEIYQKYMKNMTPSLDNVLDIALEKYEWLKAGHPGREYYDTFDDDDDDGDDDDIHILEETFPF